MTDDAVICTVQRLIDRGRLPGPIDEAIWAVRRHLPTIATAEHAADVFARAVIARHQTAQRIVKPIMARRSRPQPKHTRAR